MREFYNVDESLDRLPTVEVDRRQTRLLRLDQVPVGETVALACEATVVDRQEVEGLDGMPETTVVLELRLAREPVQPAEGRPETVNAKRLSRIYDMSDMD